jgi:hypothetical protein
MGKWKKGKWTGVKFHSIGGGKLVSEPMTRKQWLSRKSPARRKRILKLEKQGKLWIKV